MVGYLLLFGFLDLESFCLFVRPASPPFFAFVLINLSTRKIKFLKPSAVFRLYYLVGSGFKTKTKF